MSKIKDAFETVTKHENQLTRHFLEFLNSQQEISVFGISDVDASNRVPTFGFRIADHDPGKVARSLEKYNIAIRYGDFYARRLTDFLGLTTTNGVVRASMVHYNTLEEVDALIDGLEREWM